MMNTFRNFFSDAKTISFREPLAELLGAFTEDGSIVEYSFTDTVKMAGHACPTVTGAFVACRKALERLYPDSLPVRGEIEVTVFGEPDESVYGVMGQVFCFLTGAAPETGFRGLAHKFKRKDLLKFSTEKPDPEAMSFEFRRTDTGRHVRAAFFPSRIPFPPELSNKMGLLMEKVIWEAAGKEEKKAFQDLWTEKIKMMLIEEKEIDNWLVFS